MTSSPKNNIYAGRSKLVPSFSTPAGARGSDRRAGIQAKVCFTRPAKIKYAALLWIVWSSFQCRNHLPTPKELRTTRILGS